MADKKLSEILSTNPVTAAPTGAEPIETVVAATSEAFTFAQLSNHPLNAQTGTTYTLAITDQGKVVTMSNAAANTLTVPLNATIAFPIGALLIVRQIGAGGTTIAAAGGVTIELDTNASLVMDGAQQQILMHKTATDTWHAAPVATGSGGGSVTGTEIKGARVAKSSGQSITGGATTTLTWQTELFDDNNIVDLGSFNSRLTVPAGVTRAIITVNIDTANDAHTLIDLFIFKNGAAASECFSGFGADYSGSKGASVSTGVVEVVEGDYFEAKVFQTNTANIDAQTATNFSMITFEDITAGPAVAVMANGARVELSAGESITSGATQTVNWDTEVFDDNGMVDIGGNPSRITVPTGITRVALTFGVDTAATTQDFIYLFIRKNGTTDMALVGLPGDFTGSKGLNISTGILNVVAGDYFEARVFFQSTTMDIDAVPGTFFSMTTYETSSAGFHGALLQLDTNDTGINGTKTIVWENEIYDTDGFADIGTDDDRFTIPANVTKVQCNATLEVANHSIGTAHAITIKHFNSADALQRQYVMGGEQGFSNVIGSITTPVIVVAATDYLTVIFATADTNYDIISADFGLEYKDGTL